MKRILTFVLGAILLFFAGWPSTASAATEAEKLAAIQMGLTHLCTLQNANGSWSGYADAYTGAAVFAFLSQQGKWPTPAQCTNNGNTLTFQTVILNGITFLLNDAVLVPNLQNNAAGQNICPGGSGTSCKGVYWYASDQTYTTGFVSSAINVYGISQGVNNVAPSTGQLAGLTWLQIAQYITNEFASYQSVETTAGADYAGGWHYTPGQADADMSTAQWGVISIGYDELAGATTPSFVRTLMKNNWLVADQASNGEACYQLPGGLCTHSDTGGWLTSMAFVGQANNPAANLALAWLNLHWTDATNGDWYGIFVPAGSGSGCANTASTSSINIYSPTGAAIGGCSPYAYPMWAVYKGMESNVGLADNSHVLPANLKTDCGKSIGHLPSASSPSGGVCNWWEDQNEFLVRTQTTSPASAAGSWVDNFADWPDPLDTALFVNILGAVPLPASITQGGAPSVPALSLWGLVALAVMLVGFAAFWLRKARPQQS